jgi:hypothetical protein
LRITIREYALLLRETFMEEKGEAASKGILKIPFGGFVLAFYGKSTS